MMEDLEETYCTAQCLFYKDGTCLKDMKPVYLYEPCHNHKKVFSDEEEKWKFETRAQDAGNLNHIDYITRMEAYIAYLEKLIEDYLSLTR